MGLFDLVKDVISLPVDVLKDVVSLPEKLSGDEESDVLRRLKKIIAEDLEER